MYLIQLESLHAVLLDTPLIKMIAVLTGTLTQKV